VTVQSNRRARTPELQVRISRAIRAVERKPRCTFSRRQRKFGEHLVPNDSLGQPEIRTVCSHRQRIRTWQASSSTTDVRAKRYRYTGKERDPETGLYYHGARYYAPWLSRWTSADPAGFVDGTDLYCYVRNNPLTWLDLDGHESPRPAYE